MPETTLCTRSEGRAVAGDAQSCCSEALRRLLLSAGGCPGEWLQSPSGKAAQFTVRSSLSFREKPPHPFLPSSPGGCWLTFSRALYRGKLANVRHCWPAGGFGLVCTIFNKSELVANIKKIERVYIKIFSWKIRSLGSTGPMLHDSIWQGLSKAPCFRPLLALPVPVNTRISAFA